MVATAARSRPYKKQTRSTPRGWIEEAFHMGVTRPKHLLDKKVEESDSKVQHRLLFPRSFKESPIKNGFICGEQEAAMLEDTRRGVNLKVPPRFHDRPLRVVIKLRSRDEITAATDCDEKLKKRKIQSPSDEDETDIKMTYEVEESKGSTQHLQEDYLLHVSEEFADKIMDDVMEELEEIQLKKEWPPFRLLVKLPRLIDVLARRRPQLKNCFLDRGILDVLEKWLRRSEQHPTVVTAILRSLCDLPVNDILAQHLNLWCRQIGREVRFLSESKVETPTNKRLACQLIQKWAPIYTPYTTRAPQVSSTMAMSAPDNFIVQTDKHRAADAKPEVTKKMKRFKPPNKKPAAKLRAEGSGRLYLRTCV